MLVCHYCGVSGATCNLAGDHLKPISKGGSNKARNIVPACNVCNSIKGNRTIEASRFRLVQKMLGWPRFSLEQIEWLRTRGFDLSEYDGAELAYERRARERDRGKRRAIACADPVTRAALPSIRRET